MVSATHAALYAQLIIDGKEYGVHVFMVQLRDENLKLLPGIELGDIGTKIGDNTVDIGYLRLKDFRIPRKYMFEKRQHVEADGTYVKHGDPKAKGPQAEKMHYLTMMGARISMVANSAGSLAKACTIAIRYSAVRRQGFQNTSADQSFQGLENQILDYKMHQYRLFKQLATAYAIRFVGRWVEKRMEEIRFAQTDEPNVDSDLPEMHATSAGLKGLCCERVALGIEECRKCCGGNGYLLASGIGPLEADYKWRATAEGDTIVMLLQTARYLVKSYQSALNGEPQSGTASYLNSLKNASFNPMRDAKPTPPTAIDGYYNLDYLEKLFAYRAIVNVTLAGQALESEKRKGETFDSAWQNLTLKMVKTGESHVTYFILKRFKDTVEKVEDAQCKNVLSKLCSLFALSEILDGSQWGGLIDVEEFGKVENAVSKLCASLRPEAVTLVDAWEFPDRVLASTLGRYDGNVYEAIYEASVKSPLNKKEVPDCIEAMRPYLDFDYLKTIHHVPNDSKL